MEPSRNLAERLFRRALRKARLPGAEVKRNEYAVLTYKWTAPCAEIRALYASIKPRDIMLSCKVTHIHFDCDQYSWEKKLTNIRLKRRMVEDAISEIQAFLADRIAATVSYDPTGKEHSFGWCKKERLAESLSYCRKIFGPGMTQKAWFWSGPA